MCSTMYIRGLFQFSLGTADYGSVSSLVVLKGAKKFFVPTFTVDADRTASFGVLAASFVECLSWLQSSLKPSPCFVCSTWVGASLQDIFKIT
jgi:hypothetical protein